MKIMNYLGFENKTIKKNTKAMRHQRQICAAVSSFHNETSQDVHLFSSKSSNELNWISKLAILNVYEFKVNNQIMLIGNISQQNILYLILVADLSTIMLSLYHNWQFQAFVGKFALKDKLGLKNWFIISIIWRI